MVQKNKKEKKCSIQKRVMNRCYRSSARNLLKFLKIKIKGKNLKLSFEANEKARSELASLTRAVYCAFDKAARKGAIHKNTAARKKSQAQLIYNTLISLP